MKSLSHERCHSRDHKDRASNTGVISYIRSYLSNKMNHSSSSTGDTCRFSGTTGTASHFSGCDFASSVSSVDRCHKKVSSDVTSSSSSLRGTKSHLFKSSSSDRKSYLKSSSDGQVKSVFSNVTHNSRLSHHKHHHPDTCSSSHAFTSGKGTHCTRMGVSKSNSCASTAQSTFSLTSGYSSQSSSKSNSIMPLFDPRAEITRKYIVPPPNRSINDISSSFR